MTSDATWELQQAVFTALRADASLKLLISDPPRVFDHVPQNTAPPYIVIGEATTAPFDTKDTDGMEQTVIVHSWSIYRGLKETKLIMSAILDALDQVALTISGNTLALLRFEFSDTFLDADGLTRHGVQRFRAITEVV